MTDNNFFKDSTYKQDDGITSIKEGQLVGEIPNQMSGRLNDFENQSQWGGVQGGPNSEAYFPQIAKYHESGP